MEDKSAFQNSVGKICEPLPGAELSDPLGEGHHAWKICDKMFASIGARVEGVSVKTPDIETATMLIETGVGRRAKYFHRSWVQLPLDADFGEMKYRIETSYSIVRGGLTKKLQASLRPWPMEA